MNRTPALLARRAAGLSRERAAKLLKVHPDTLSRLEANGGWPEFRAWQAARIYKCSPDLFLYGRPDAATARSRKHGRSTDATDPAPTN